jgi:hypothetical protein
MVDASSIELLVQMGQSLASFAADAGLPADSAPESDMDQDGVPLVVEYYLNLSASDISTLAAPIRDPTTGEIVWVLAPNPLLGPGFSAEVETSTDLVQWHRGTSLDGITWRSGTASDTHRFMRLKVTTH